MLTRLARLRKDATFASRVPHTCGHNSVYGKIRDSRLKRAPVRDPVEAPGAPAWVQEFTICSRLGAPGGLASANPSLTEAWFSRGVYPWLSSAWGFLPSLAPFSVAQWVVVAALAFCIGWLGFYLVAFVRGRGRRRFVLWRALTTMLAVLSVAYCIFALMCGLNSIHAAAGLRAEDAGFELPHPPAQPPSAPQS